MHKNAELPPGTHLERSRRQLLILLVLALYAVLGLFQLGKCDLESDEGRFGVSAVNILTDYHQLATVSEDPLGAPGTKPYMYPSMLAGAIAVLGKNELAVRSVNLMILAVAAFFLYGFVMILLKDRSIALLTFAFFLLNPGTISYARTAMPEPSVVLWGCVALYGVTKFGDTRHTAWGIFCGVALGFAFLSKMWLVFPFGLACFTMFLSLLVENPTRKHMFVPLIAFIAFVFVSASHLLLVRLWEPQELAYWLHIYFGTTFSSRVAGVGYDPVMWFRPWWFYFAAFFKASFFGLPIFLLGIVEIWKRRLIVSGATAGALLVVVAVLSLFRVKEAAYMFPAFPGIILLVALGWKRFFREPSSKEILSVTVLSMMLAGAFYRVGVYPRRDWVLIELLYLLCLAAGMTSKRYGILTKRIAAIGMVTAMIFADVVVVQKDLDHRTYYREIARYFKASLRDTRPQQVVFVSPEFPSLQFYTFRSGHYWQTYLFHESDSTFEADLLNHARVFYVVDPTGKLYGGKVSPREWAALQNDGREVTSDLERCVGEKIPLRVFVPLGAQPTATSSLIQDGKELAP